MPIIFAAISPHPPIILPGIGSANDRAQVIDTILALDRLGGDLKAVVPDIIVISSPHPDWGFNVPLSFLAGKKLEEDLEDNIRPYLIGLDSPEFYFNEGKNVYETVIKNSNSRFALVASGDLSHRLKEDGPYGFHPDGPEFDRDLRAALLNKDIETILGLDEKYPEAGECGLRSFSFMLGILEASGTDWRAQELSYEGPFGVGYLVMDFKL